MNRFFTFFLLLLTCNMLISANEAMWEASARVGHPFGLLPPLSTMTGHTPSNPFAYSPAQKIVCAPELVGSTYETVCHDVSVNGGYSINTISNYYNTFSSKSEQMGISSTPSDTGTTIWGAGDVVKGLLAFVTVFAGSITNIKPTLNMFLPYFPGKDQILTIIEIFWILGLIMTFMVMIMGRYNPSTS